MKTYTQIYTFKIDHPARFKEKLNQYLAAYNFELQSDSADRIIYIKKGSFFDGWKLNPLNRKSTIEIDLTQNKKVSIQFEIDGIYITPIVFATLFDAFFYNLEQFVNYNSDFKEINHHEIVKAKKKMLTYLGVILLGAVIGLLIGIAISKAIGLKLFEYAGIIFGVMATEKFLNEKLNNNNILQ